MPLPEPEANPLAGRIFEIEVAAIEKRKAATKSAKKLELYDNEISALTAAASLYALLSDARAEVARGRMTEQRRRESEVELLSDATEAVAASFPYDFLHKTMSTRFFEFLGDAARCMLASTSEFHPVSFRALLNDGWRAIGRAEEVAWSIEQSHETASKGGKGGTSRGARELRVALLEGTTCGTIEELAERHFMTPRNVSFVKAWFRQRQAN